MADFELLAPGGHQKLVDEVEDRLDLKSDIDGYYAQLTAGAADNLTGRGDSTTASFLYRTAGGTADIETGQAVAKSVKGNTLVWNQLMNTSPYWNDNGNTSHAVSDDVVTVTATSTTSFGVYKASSAIGGGKGLVVGHKYCGIVDVKPSVSIKAYFGLNSANVGTDPLAFGKDMTVGAWNRVSGIATLTTLTNAGIRIGGGGLATLVAGDNFQMKNVMLFDLTQMFGAGNEPSTVAEFEALFPLPYYEYDAGSLLSVNMEGIETVGFNQWDEEWEVAGIDVNTGEPVTGQNKVISKNLIPVFPSTVYYCKSPNIATYPFWYDANGDYLGYSTTPITNTTFQTPANCYYVRFRAGDSTRPISTLAKGDVIINLSWSGRRNGEYEPFWSSQRLIDVATYFPDGMRSAGSVYDELTSTEAITRVGVVDLGTLTWEYQQGSAGGNRFRALIPGGAIPGGTNRDYPFTNGSKYVKRIVDAMTDLDNGIGIGGTTDLYVYIKDPSYDGTTLAAFKAQLSGQYIHYVLATPTTTPIDPPLNLSYRVDDFGTERVMVPEDERSAPPVLDIAYGLNVVDFVRRAPTEYISAASFRQYLLARDAHDSTTTTTTWDDTDNRYEFAITDTVTEG